MTSGQIRELFLKGTTESKKCKICDFVDVAKYVSPKLELDDNEIDYILSIDILELAKKCTDDDVIYNMLDMGWSLSKDKKLLVKKY